MWRFGLCCLFLYNGNRKGINVCFLISFNNRNVIVIVFDVFFFIILNRNVILIVFEVDLFIWYFSFRNVVFDVYLGCFIGS